MVVWRFSRMNKKEMMVSSFQKPVSGCSHPPDLNLNFKSVIENGEREKNEGIDMNALVIEPLMGI